MKMHYRPDQEHLAYILSSAVWHYYQYTEGIVNTKQGEQIIRMFLKEQDIIRNKLVPALKSPLPGDRLELCFNDKETAELLDKILHHYLDETRDILQTIEDPVITKKCMEDIDIIENELFKAIHCSV